MGNKFLLKKSVLFFGQKGCKNSSEALLFLKSLGCSVLPFFGGQRNDSFEEKNIDWEGDFIFSYRCYWRIPIQTINNAKIAAINFHPGTPDYPGSGAYCWALYDKKDAFGVTVHLMNEKIDNGKILEVSRFKMDETYDLRELIDKTYQFSLEVFKTFLTNLDNASNIEVRDFFSKDAADNWAGKANKISDLERMKDLTSDLSFSEFQRRIRSFHLPNYPIRLKHHGQTFQLSKEKGCNKK